MSYPAENIVPSPVSNRQRASRPRRVAARVSRISWSSAPRLAGFEIFSRATNGAGSSSSSLPDASSLVEELFEDNERVALRHRLALLAADLLHSALVLGLNGHLHLHGLEDDERVALLHLLSHLTLDLPNGAGDVGLDVWQLKSSCPRVCGTIPVRASGNSGRGGRSQRGRAAWRHAQGAAVGVPGSA